MKDRVFIYCLSDPITKAVRYVGKTQNLQHRYSRHCESKENTPKGRWIQSLRQSGLKPIIECLEEVERSSGADCEEFWIETFRFYGCDLTNSHTWGLSALSMESRNKLAKKMIGHAVSNEARIKIRSALTGRKLGPLSDLTKQKLSNAHLKRRASMCRDIKPASIHKRQVYGEQSHLSKITENQVREIRKLDSIVAHTSIARMFGISQSQVSRIINRKKWAHVL